MRTVMLAILAFVAAATGAGANILNGPQLRVADPERAALSAYGAAYRAARARAEAYAGAAGLRIARILAIRDGGGAAPPVPYEQASGRMAMPPPVMATAEQAIRPGLSTSEVAVAVDFALAPR